jgi:uncharacterized protein (DUF433 family)
MKSLRTSVAAAMGGAVLVAGLLVGVSIAFADDSDAPTISEKKDNHPTRGWVRDLISDIADQIDVSIYEIADRLKDGESIEDIADDLGVDLEAARGRVLDEIEARVAAGDLTEEQGDALRERIESFDFSDVPNHDRGFRFGFDRGPFDFSFEFDRSELHELLGSGLSLDEVLEELGVDLDAALEAARESAVDHIDKMVEDGVISEERAAEMKDKLEECELGDGFPFSDRGFFFERRPRGQGFGFFDRDGSADDANAENVRFSA